MTTIQLEILNENNLYPSSRQSEKEHTLKKQSLYAFRAVSDSAFSTILYEFLCKGVCFNCLNSSPVIFVFSELFLGSVLGVLSVFANLVGIEERQAESSKRALQELEIESLELVSEWENLENSSEQLKIFNSSEVQDAVEWFEALDELEGPNAMKFFQLIASDRCVEKRVTLARCLGNCLLRSNIVLSVLQHLAFDDKSIFVRTAAQQSIMTLMKNGILPVSGDYDTIFAETRVPSYVRLEKTSNQINANNMKNSETQSPFSSSLFLYDSQRHDKLAVKTSGMWWNSNSEISLNPFEHMDIWDVCVFCSLGSIIIGVQIYCLCHAVYFPFRFVALGWIFGVGGLAVYPYSSKIWQLFNDKRWTKWIH